MMVLCAVCTQSGCVKKQMKFFKGHETVPISGIKPDCLLKTRNTKNTAIYIVTHLLKWSPMIKGRTDHIF